MTTASNPLAIIEGVDDKLNQFRTLGNIYAEYDLFEGLSQSPNEQLSSLGREGVDSIETRELSRSNPSRLLATPRRFIDRSSSKRR